MAVTKKKPVSGYCNGVNKQPQHEGTKPVSSTGSPLPVCVFWQTCGCNCHEQITSMYAAVGMDREPPEQSVEFLARVRAQHHEFDLTGTLLDGELAALSIPGGVDTPNDDEGTPTAPVRADNGGVSGTIQPPARPVFTATPTGRRARGQLEYDVLQVCQEFAREVWDWPECTPKLVAERIGKMNATEAPSTGAINAVWDRWEKLEFAEQAKKPSRFVQFTGDSSERRLDYLKQSTKRAKKRGQAEMKRGIPRPRVRS